MNNRYPLWKYLLIVLIIGVGVIYGLPNLYPPDPAIQLTPRVSGEFDPSVLEKATQELEKANIEFFNEEILDGSAQIRLKSLDDQLKAKQIVNRILIQDYVIALNMAPNTPEWLLSLGASPMSLGLDLSGGVHFLMEVDIEEAVGKRLENYVGSLKRELREEKIRFRRIELQGDNLVLRFPKEEYRDQAESFLRSRYREFIQVTEEDSDKNPFLLKLSMSEQDVKTMRDDIISQNLTTIRNRVNALGVSEPLVQKQGANRIVVELAGVQDAATAKKILGKAANLEFRLQAKSDASRSTTETFEFKDSNSGQRSATLEKDIITTGASVSNASVGYDENGLPQVNISLDSEGGTRMSKVTRHAVGRRMGVLFVEHKTRVDDIQIIDGEEVRKETRYEEKKIISLATIQSTLGSSFRITGLDNPGEASELALLLKAGALAAPMYFVEERTVGPSLGQENIELGMKSVQIGFVLVLLFMLVYYRIFGLFANVALGLNLVLMVACMSLLSATLTLPGIAGIVLTVGMAVDANVLIFSRIKEELKSGLPPQMAIHRGYEQAFTTIMDANITTLIASVILYAIGTGPVKGFAVTLSLGILTSMFTAIVVTRGLANLWYGGRRNLQKIWI